MNQADFEKLAEMRLREAYALFDAGKYAGS